MSEDMHTGSSMEDAGSVAAGMAQLYRKKALVMATLERLPKAGYNSQQNYPYVTASDVKDALRVAMSEAGLSLRMTALHVERHSTEKGTRTIVDFAISICDGETGASETSRWQGIGIDYGNDDKGFNKASTQAVKYFLMANFLGSAFEEDKNDGDKDSTAQQRTRNQPRNTGTQRAANNGKSGDDFKPPAWWNPVMQRVIKPYYAGNQQHATNSIKKLLADKKLWADMAPDAAIAVIETHVRDKQAQPE